MAWFWRVGTCFDGDGQPRWANARRHGSGTCYAVTTDQTGCQGPCSRSIFDIHALRRIFGVGRTAGYDLTRSAGFPPPIVISSRCLRWPVEDTLAYRDGLSAASRPGPASPPPPCSDTRPFPGLCSLECIVPLTTPAGYELTAELRRRVEQARGERDAGINPSGLLFPQ